MSALTPWLPVLAALAVLIECARIIRREPQSHRATLLANRIAALLLLGAVYSAYERSDFAVWLYFSGALLAFGGELTLRLRGKKHSKNDRDENKAG